MDYKKLEGVIHSIVKKKRQYVSESKKNAENYHRIQADYLQKIRKTCQIKRRVFNSKTIPEYEPLSKYTDPIDKVPNISPSLRSVLFSPGVHYMKDPRTRHVNFNPSLLNIPHIDNFKFDKITPFVSPSHDKRLVEVSRLANSETVDPGSTIRYYSSTSSLTGILRQLHLLLSNNRPLDTSFLSKTFPATTSMSASAKFPVSSVVTPKSNQEGLPPLFSIDSDRSADTELVLSCLGNVMELMLTKDPETFSKYLKSSSEDPEPSTGSAYHYARFGKLLMRSQLDAKDVELPGTGVFDLKTRAVCAIRYDIPHTDFVPTNYEINRTNGLYESFEREVFEMARIVMFKYGLQARIGDMDGIFVAYHNAKSILGFQYFPLSAIDDIFFGHTDPASMDVYHYRAPKPSEDDHSAQEKLQNIVDDIGQHWQNKREVLSSFMANYEFKVSLSILQDVMDQATAKTHGKSFRMLVNYRGGDALYSGEPHVEVIINEIDESTIGKLTQLGDEKQAQNREEMSSLLPSDRIKQLSLNRFKQRKQFDRLNSEIYGKTSQSGMYMFEIRNSHVIDGEQCHDRYPTPPIGILDSNQRHSWQIDYQIDEITDRSYMKERYFSEVGNISMHSFSGASADMASLHEQPSRVQVDHSATYFQNVFRAYSMKAVERGKKFLRSVYGKHQEE